MDLKSLADAVIAPLAAGFVALARLELPAADAPTLAAKAEGDIKHYMRGKIGFGVDFLWASNEFRAEMSRVIAEEVSPTRAAGESLPLGQAGA